MSAKPETRPDLTDRDAILEQLGDFPVRLESPFREALEACPERFRPWLWDVLRERPEAARNDPDPFLDDVVRSGLVSAVLMHVEANDLTADDRGRGAWGGWLPNTVIVPAVLRFALESENPVWRESAVRWLPQYPGGGRDELVALLAPALAWPSGDARHVAAVHLAELAPDTPGLSEALLDAACSEWYRTRAEAYDGGRYGAGLALDHLRRIGPSWLRPDLLAALVAGRCENAAAGAKLYLEWGGDAAELVERSWVAPPGAECQIVAMLGALPADTAGLVPRLVSLVSSLDARDQRRLVFIRLGCRADLFLPALGLCAGYGNCVALAAYLRLLPGRPEWWADEDRWMLALRGRPAGDAVWSVYADWLGDRSDPREEFIRLTHAAALCAGDEAARELRGQVSAWHDVHGRGWEDVYETVCSFVPDPPAVGAGEDIPGGRVGGSATAR